MDKEEKNRDKVITADFRSANNNQTKKPANMPGNQTNPIYKQLFKLVHTELTKQKTDYKSFSRFKPEDLK